MKIELDERQILLVQKTTANIGCGAGRYRIGLETLYIDKTEANISPLHDVYIIILRNKEDMVKP